MARYIDADKFRNWILKQKRLSKYYTIQMLDETSAADVQEVKHGHWEHDAGIWSNFEMCSLCKLWTKSSFEYDYCPNCGAKMDEEK